MDELQAIRRLKKGDIGGLEYLVARYQVRAARATFLITRDDLLTDGIVQSILMTFRFVAPPQPVTYEAMMADNGKTFVMNTRDKLRLNLDYGYGWSTISDFNPTVMLGAGDWSYAFASGTATLTMIGDHLPT